MYFHFASCDSGWTGQEPGQAGAPGEPGYVIREIFWYIILAGVSTLQDSGHPGPGDRGRTKKLLARAHKRGVMRVNKKAIIDLWLQKMCVRFVANLWEGEGYNIYHLSFINTWHLDKRNLNEMLILDVCLGLGMDAWALMVAVLAIWIQRSNKESEATRSQINSVIFMVVNQ